MKQDQKQEFWLQITHVTIMKEDTLPGKIAFLSVMIKNGDVFSHWRLPLYTFAQAAELDVLHLEEYQEIEGKLA